MRLLRTLLLLFSLCVAAHAGSLITATITVTNTPADGDTVIVNASTRTWKTSVATPANQITIGASIGANATNLFNQVAGTPFTTLTINRSGTNGITLRGAVDQTIAVTITGTWGTYSLSTNTTADGQSIIVPGASHPTQSKQTNIVSQFATDFGVYSTNALAAGTTLVGNLVQTSGSQTVAGAKAFTGANSHVNTGQSWDGGTITNVYIGSSNVWIGTANIYGVLNMSNASPSMTFYDTDGSADNKGVQAFLANGDFYLIAYDDAFSSFSYFMQATRTGSTVDGIAFPNGVIQVGGGGGTSDRLRVTGATRFDRNDSTTLATGNNAAVDLGNRTFCRIASGPGAAFTINGIANGGDGQWHIIYNATGFNMTIANDSGTDPTPANRIYTNTGADVSTTGNGCVTVIYDSSASRWIVTALQQ